MAFSVWRIEDDCLRATPKIRIDYTGPNPLGLSRRALEVVQRVLGIKRIDIWEADFRWDSSADPRPFYIRAYAPKALDIRTFILIEFVFRGNQPKDPTRSERLSIDIGARLRTDYPLKGILQQSFFYRTLLKAYHHISYEGERRKYIATCTEIVERVAAEIRKLI